MLKPMSKTLVIATWLIAVLVWGTPEAWAQRGVRPPARTSETVRLYKSRDPAMQSVRARLNEFDNWLAARRRAGVKTTRADIDAYVSKHINALHDDILGVKQARIHEEVRKKALDSYKPLTLFDEAKDARSVMRAAQFRGMNTYNGRIESTAELIARQARIIERRREIVELLREIDPEIFVPPERPRDLQFYFRPRDYSRPDRSSSVVPLEFSYEMRCLEGLTFGDTEDAIELTKGLQVLLREVAPVAKAARSMLPQIGTEGAHALVWNSAIEPLFNRANISGPEIVAAKLAFGFEQPAASDPERVQPDRKPFDCRPPLRQLGRLGGERDVATQKYGPMVDRFGAGTVEPSGQARRWPEEFRMLPERSQVVLDGLAIHLAPYSKAAKKSLSDLGLKSPPMVRPEDWDSLGFEHQLAAYALAAEAGRAGGSEAFIAWASRALAKDYGGIRLFLSEHNDARWVEDAGPIAGSDFNSFETNWDTLPNLLQPGEQALNARSALPANQSAAFEGIVSFVHRDGFGGTYSCLKNVFGLPENVAATCVYTAGDLPAQLWKGFQSIPEASREEVMDRAGKRLATAVLSRAFPNDFADSSLMHAVEVFGTPRQIAEMKVRLATLGDSHAQPDSNMSTPSGEHKPSVESDEAGGHAEQNQREAVGGGKPPEPPPSGVGAGADSPDPRGPRYSPGHYGLYEGVQIADRIDLHERVVRIRATCTYEFVLRRPDGTSAQLRVHCGNRDGMTLLLDHTAKLWTAGGFEIWRNPLATDDPYLRSLLTLYGTPNGQPGNFRADPQGELLESLTYLHPDREAEPRDDLEGAINGRDPKALDAALAAKPWLPSQLDAHSDHGKTLLMSAILNADLESAEMLLSHGANPYVSDGTGHMAWHMAASAANPAAIDLLAKFGPYPLDACKDQLSALFHAVPAEGRFTSDQVETVAAIIRGGGSALERCGDGSTLLHVAVQQRDLSLLKALLVRSCNLDTFDDVGRTPLILAVLLGWDEGAELLLQSGASPNGRSLRRDLGVRVADIWSWETCGMAGSSGLLLASARDISVNPPVLVLAAGLGREHIVNLLLAKGADPNLSSLDGITPLYAAACGMRLLESSDDRWKSLKNRVHHNAEETEAARLAVVASLLRAGAKVDASRPDISVTPLMAAAFFGRHEIVEALLEAGAATDPKDIAGCDAAEHGQRAFAILDGRGRATGFDWTHDKDDVKEVLRLLGKAPDGEYKLRLPDQPDEQLTQEQFLERMLTRSVSLPSNPEFSGEDTSEQMLLALSLWSSRYSRSPDPVDTLHSIWKMIAKEKTPSVPLGTRDHLGMRDGSGRTWLMYVAGAIDDPLHTANGPFIQDMSLYLYDRADADDPRHHLGCAEVLNRIEPFARSFLVNSQDNRGWTAAMYAARAGRFATVEYLERYGADLDKASKKGLTARDLMKWQEGTGPLPEGTWLPVDPETK